jgi:hypothetical protein
MVAGDMAAIMYQRRKEEIRKNHRRIHMALTNNEIPLLSYKIHFVKYASISWG